MIMIIIVIHDIQKWNTKSTSKSLIIKKVKILRHTDMSEWWYDGMTAGDMKYIFTSKWSQIILRKSQETSGQTNKRFSKYATKYTAAGLPPTPTIWVGLNVLSRTEKISMRFFHVCVIMLSYIYTFRILKNVIVVTVTSLELVSPGA